MASYAVLSFVDSMNNVLMENGMQSLISLLSSEHTIMQNEALVAIITLLASAKGSFVLLYQLLLQLEVLLIYFKVHLFLNADSSTFRGSNVVVVS